MSDERKMRPFHALVILALVSTLAMADVKVREPVAAAFRALDLNTDQLISKQEANADKSLLDRFAAVDSDADGFVSEEEYLARPDNRPFE